jgi:hypothetical protein
MKRLTLIILLALAIPQLHAQWANTIDSLAMVDLYDSTNGPNWQFQGSWKTSEPLSRWQGLTVVNGRVTRISFIGGFFEERTGYLPRSVYRATALQSLFFLDPGLAVYDFKGLCDSLVNLTDIYFQGALSTTETEITNSICNLTQLKSLTLYREFMTPYPPYDFRIQKLPDC